MQPTKLHTSTITNTQIFVAIFAAFLAGGLAFVTFPSSGEKNVSADVCGVAAVNFGNSCAREKLRGGSFVCDNGVEMAFGEQCQTLESWIRFAKQECAKLSCQTVPQNAPSHMAATPVPPLDIVEVNVTIKN